MPTYGDYAITTHQIHKSYGKLEVLKGIDLSVERGTILALLGPNGAGKTTMVSILSTLLRPDGGTAIVNGFDVVKEPNRVRATIGLIGQNAAVDKYLSGRKNLEMMGRLYRLSKRDAERRADELLEAFDLVDAASRPAKTYSGGMRRRLDLAAGLIASPPIIFLDEPTTGLDPRSRLAMWDIIKGLVQSGATLLLTTQYLDEADQLADQIVVIDDGRVISEGTPDELKRRVGNERLELVIAPESDFARAQEVVAGPALQADEKRRAVSVAIEGVREIREALAGLESAGIEVETLSVQKPTLDDVFLQLTGTQATTQTADESVSAGESNHGAV